MREGLYVEVLSASRDYAPVAPQHDFARNLRRARARANLSQEALGERCGLHRTEISFLERGLREPRLSTIVRLAKGLGIPPGQLLRGL
jgi:transcriptional regulator with XRE-family HTH domain